MKTPENDDFYDTKKTLLLFQGYSEVFDVASTSATVFQCKERQDLNTMKT